MPQHVAHLPRTGFDMSQSFAFTSSSGMLLPVYQDVLNVGETVYLNGSLFSRTQPLVNAAMADVDVYLDWFFVPIPMLYQLFPSIRYATNDFFSSVFSDQVFMSGTNLPLCQLDGVSDEIHLLTYGSQTRYAFAHGGFSNSFDCLGKQTFRLWNHLGLNPYGIFHGDDTAPNYKTESNPTVFPLFGLAYQAIFQDYYRLEDYEYRNVRSFNVDKYHDQQDSVDMMTDLTEGRWQLRYRPRHKDYFTSVKVNPILGSMNLTALDRSSPGDILSKVDSYLDDGQILPVSITGSYQNVSAGSIANGMTQTAGKTLNTTSNIRNLFAVEKLMRIIGRARKDYDSQVLAHFGFKVPHDVKHQLSHLFTQHALLHIGEVVSTANTYEWNSDTQTSKGAQLGAIGGKGYVSIPNNKQAYKFTAPVDGVVMCIYSCAPRFRYNRTFDKQNSITTRLDFFTPEFDKLGMQPLYRYEADSSKVGTADRLGWQYRYAQHKSKYDRASEAFSNPSTGSNYYKSWLLSREGFRVYQSQGNPLNAEDFYVSPKDLDNIMVIKYETAWADSYKTYPYLMFGTDPFINDFRASVKKVSTMSPTGEPEL